MNVRHTLICFLFLTLQDGNTGLINAQIITAKEGETFTHRCLSFHFSLLGKTKFFCKEECEGKGILVKTTADKDQSGRYNIESTKVDLFSSVLYVSITNLILSDSGRYRCDLNRSFLPDLSKNFELRVEVAPITSKPNWTLRPSSTSVPSASTTQSLSSSSGGSTPSSASPEDTTQSEQQHTPAAASGNMVEGTLLYVCVTLVVMIIVLSVTVLIFFKKRARKPKEPPEETGYANVTEGNHDHEIREKDRQSTSPPVQISTVYTSAKYTKPNAVESSDEYSLVTAVSSQEKTDDNSNKLIYSEVDFSNSAAASFNSAPRGDAANVIYSVPRVEDKDPPLYSTVTAHQL